jgi:hypothetical protein
MLFNETAFYCRVYVVSSFSQWRHVRHIVWLHILMRREALQTPLSGAVMTIHPANEFVNTGRINVSTCDSQVSTLDLMEVFDRRERVTIGDGRVVKG